ncbi:hypothetical protein [Kitasatospora brasiliensis]|uniref:hypothetical protein n=1 Tax=Kitasatospora brasiliensis TaxID=3058040 RepID=UPI002931013F|nr:hypothetical protein [Kitasatospora sp. K002]
MQMTPTYQQALNGTLVSQNTGNTGQFTFYNATEIPLGGYLVSDTGIWLGMVPGGTGFGTGNPSMLLKPDTRWSTFTSPIDFGWYFIFVNYYSGAFAAVYPATAAVPWQGSEYILNVSCSDLLNPNDIGSPPIPNEAVVIPPDSPRVVVGCGGVNGNSIAREQYWQRLPNSYCIAKGEQRTENYTTTSGIEVTTTQQSQLATSLGVNAGAGWGPISAGISASISASSSTSQQISTNTQTTSFLSQDFDNVKGSTTQMFLYWQLTDVITVFDPEGNALSSLIYGSEAPAVIDGPYDPSNLPPRPLRKEVPMSPQMRELLAKG